MPLDAAHDKGDQARTTTAEPDFDEYVVSSRRQMTDCVEEIEFVYAYSKKCDPSTASASTKANLLGMKDNLDANFRKFNELWTEVGAHFDRKRMFADFPTEDDKRQKSKIRSEYYTAIGRIQMCNNETQERIRAEVSNVTLSDSRPTKNLPKMNLPFFDGQLTHWPKFRDSFSSMVHEEKLTPIEKFHYLRASLKGPALSVIASLKIEEANYPLAWQAILDTYNQPRMLASAYLDQLLSFKAIQGKATPEALNQFLSSISDTVAAFRLLNVEREAQFILFHLSVRCLDQQTREAFETRQGRDEFPTIDQLTKFVRDRAIALQLAGNTNPLTEGSSRLISSVISTPKTSRPPKPKTPKTSLVSNNSTSPKSVQPAKSQPSTDIQICVACKGEPHHLLDCLTFNETSPKDRRALLKDWQGCINCLSPRHRVGDCNSKWHCRFCTERHHASLHPPAQNSTTLSASTPKEDYVILGTAVARIMDSRGQFQTVRLVIDSGSQTSFITHRCLNRLGLKMKKTERLISGIGQTMFEGAKGKAVCTIKPKDEDSVQITTTAIVVSTITSPLPSAMLPQSIIEKFRNLELADPTFWKPGHIDFLLGADLFTEIWTGVVKDIDCKGPKLLSSIFGFIVIGRIGLESPETSTSLLTIDRSENLSFQLERFWSQEEPAVIKFADPEDEKCEEHFQQTHYRLTSGRYGVRLPFRQENPQVGDSSSMALRRFYGLEKKLKNNPVMRQKYSEFLTEYLELEHMSPTTKPPRFVIPHHYIMKETPENQKLKVVFDASAQARGGSLNDHLLRGPKLQNDMRDIILCFRYHPIAFSTDIVKMFRMIEISPNDRQYLQIYWRFDPNQAVERYELNTVIYGLVCAPYQAQRVLRQLVMDHGTEFPLAAKALQQDSYVDDILTGASSDSEACVLQSQLIQLLKLGGFELSKWASNSSKILQKTSSTQADLVDLSTPEDQWVKILGLQWDPATDCFSFSIGTPNTNFTKRGVLSTIARLYDPLGFLMPTIFLMKGFIQDLWIQKLDWDEPMTAELKKSWSNVIEQLPLLSELKIPRFIGTSSDVTSVQMVGFCDASFKGYSSVLYLLVNSPSGIQSFLLSSKSKLAPIKPQSVPRLELAGAVLLAELYSAVHLQIKKLEVEILPPAFFTDSMTALAWINTPPHKLKVFVANRVVKIQELTCTTLWRHVSTEENPADLASRGALPAHLIDHDTWWSGPPWITSDPAHWPSSKVVIPTEVPEMKAVETHAFSTSHPSDNLIKWMERSSSYMTLIRAAGWLQRWLYNLRHSKCCCCPWRRGRLMKLELDQGLLLCITATQSYYFNNQKPNSMAKYADLQPFHDSKGIWRVGGRLRHSSFPEYQKHPILLPYESHLAVLIVDHYHRVYLHPGPSTLQAILQTQYWIPSLRRLIRVRGFRCKPCYTSRAKAVAPLMGDLPTYRVNGGRTFSHVGVDFAGPFPLKESNRRNASIGKVYLCLYVCMSTKALHLEAVSRLTTEAFLASFQRFTSRRGIPSDVYSDRGSNFLGAASYLKELYLWFTSQDTKQDLLEFAMNTKINWHFNPPQTPHMGGIWEAGVKSVKRHLRLIASDTHMTFEEITTWFAKIEAILNSRPLCPLSTDPNENDYLSPGHFLVGGPLVVAPEPSLLDTRENLLSRWQLVTRMTEQFWERWSHEYLRSLQKRPKWIHSKVNLEVGDLVLLKESSPPLQWKTARVTAVHPGDDQVVRVVTVRRGSSSFKRHAANVVPLPHLMTESFPKSY